MQKAIQDFLSSLPVWVDALGIIIALALLIYAVTSNRYDEDKNVAWAFVIALPLVAFSIIALGLHWSLPNQ
ncbi:hypothetical protein [Duganella sp. FT27W]|uniref:hypothetical protein n=1 Tax=Duganella sp. FT27W TaxID=2654636 RepID=UPI00128BC465|nr:hypothetical protein [Duganella sp. FT27W]MPQ56268.1 hypothetical protein [Duganella sp. FT27W]